MSEEGWSVKQPNFLQKLYQFLNLDPHPCPDVIYWAADSKQLVIAQPQKLAKEVLPKLFKHDKFASFGRQLNIYGFSRLYPGRQLKDAEGKVSEASVWEHPTLHRLSTAEEIMSIKRRAAPKLIRTRKLANGQIVRTRAGPAVEARFHEIRTIIAASRRNKLAGGVGSEVGDKCHDGTNPSSTTKHQGNQEFSPISPKCPMTFHPETLSGSSQDPHGPHLPPENPTQNRSLYTYDTDHPLSSTAATATIITTAQSPTQGHAQVIEDGWTPTLDDIEEEDSTFEIAPEHSLPYQFNGERMYHSAPASIHTSPLSPAARLFASPPFTWLSSSSTLFGNVTFNDPTPLIQTDLPSSYLLSPSASETSTPWLMPPAPPPPPVVFPASSPPAVSYLSPRNWEEEEQVPKERNYSLDSQASTQTFDSVGYDNYMSTQSVHTTIDPRWVSPNVSHWSTPNITPRSSSPITFSNSVSNYQLQPYHYHTVTASSLPLHNSLPDSSTGGGGGGGGGCNLLSYMERAIPTVPSSLPSPTFSSQGKNRSPLPLPIASVNDISSSSTFKSPKGNLPARADDFQSNFIAENNTLSFGLPVHPSGYHME